MKPAPIPEFVPFGPEWEKELTKLPKAFLINELREALRARSELEAWKLSAIECGPPLQKIGWELDLRLGDSIHDKILPELIKRRKEIEELRTEIEKLNGQTG